jgi:hypothetical protein
MSKPLFRKTTTEFTKTDVVDVLLIAGLAVASWELGRRIRNAKRALLDTKYWDTHKWEEKPLDDEPIGFMPTFVDKLLPFERALCNSQHVGTMDFCIKREGHPGTHVAKKDETGPDEYSWDNVDQRDDSWACGKKCAISEVFCTRNDLHDGMHKNGDIEWNELACTPEPAPF